MSAGTHRPWVTFDCYGTLVDWQSGFASVLEPLVGDKVTEVVRAYHRHERMVERERPHRPYKDVLVMALARAAREVGVSLTEPALRVLPRAWGSIRPFADAEPTLAALRDSGYRLAVLTNCDDDLFEVTHRTFEVPFDLFVTAERVRSYKPDPWHFRAFEHLTGVNRCDWVHVACSWYHDVAAAHAVGVRCVWLDRERTGEDPSRASVRIQSAADLLPALDELFAGRCESAATC